MVIVVVMVSIENNKNHWRGLATGTIAISTGLVTGTITITISKVLVTGTITIPITISKGLVTGTTHVLTRVLSTTKHQAWDTLELLMTCSMIRSISSLFCCYDFYHCHHHQQQHTQVNMYFNEYFNGEEEYSYVDKPQLNYDNRALSLIGDIMIWWSSLNGKWHNYVEKTPTEL